eukprot:INCI6706.1.p1 GENE.INCI6706.1~~INCI6706.1.p1  ORF type:complete len:1042 (-),score=174.53 INCI6706.1:1639-4764(-)
MASSDLEAALADIRDPKGAMLKSVIGSLQVSRKLPTTKAINGLSASIRERVLERQGALAERLRTVMDRLVKKIGGVEEKLPNNAVLHTTSGFEFVRSCSERLLERVDMCLDKAAKQNKQSRVLAADSATAPASSALSTRSRRQRPQDKFKTPPDNSNEPFVPRLKNKPNAVVPLDIFLEDPPEAFSSSVEASLDAHLSTLGADASRVPRRYCHPYSHELLQLEYCPRQYQRRDPQKYEPIDTTEYTWVDTAEALAEMNAHICDSRNVHEVAVDLEHHSYRSFLGFVCLMQVSTRSRDFLVDTLALREEMQSCNDWTTDPKIVKVFHGADRDITWLQGNFGVYVVNMFDTGQAARLLEYPSFGLAYLLKHHCNVTAEKQYQLADWRIRPLSKQMASYAQADTHYLLFVHDLLTNELKKKSTVPKHNPTNYIQAVLDRSRDLCLQRYEKPIFTPTSYQLVLSRRNQVLSPSHERIFAALYQWRDSIARQEDESTGYVLPTDSMLQLATKAPTNMGGLVEALNILRPLVRLHAKEILLLIADAKKPPTSLIKSPLPALTDVAQVTPAVRGSNSRSQSAVDHNSSVTVAKGLFTPIEGVAAAADDTRYTIANSVTPTAGELVGTPAVEVQSTSTPMNPAAASALGINHGAGNVQGGRPKPSQSPILEQDDLWSLARWTSPVPVVCDTHNKDFNANEPLPTSLEMQRSSVDLSSKLDAAIDVGGQDESAAASPSSVAGRTFLSGATARQQWLEATKEMESLAKSQTSLPRFQGKHDEHEQNVDEEPFPCGDDPTSGSTKKRPLPGSPGAQVGDTGSQDGIPETMDQIFVLSNRNRRLLKQSDKHKSLKAAGNDHRSGGIESRTRKKSSQPRTAEQEISFMESINWVPDGTTEQDLGVRTSHPPAGKKPRISGPGEGRNSGGAAKKSATTSGKDRSSNVSGGGKNSHKHPKQHHHHQSKKSLKANATAGKFTPYDMDAAKKAAGATYNPFLAKSYATQHRTNVQANAGTHHASKSRRGHLSRGGRGGRGSRSNGGRSAQGARRPTNS